MGVRTKIKKRKVGSYAGRVKSGNKKREHKTKTLAGSEHFDKNTTLIDNYKTIGIELDPNAKQEFRLKPAVAHAARANLEDIETVDVAKIQEMVVEANKRDKKRPPAPPTASEEEIRTLTALRKKYGEDFQEMSRDRRLNKLLWTPREIEKKLAFLDQANQSQ